MITNAFVNLLVIIAIGAAAGLVINRYGRSWLGRQVADATGLGDLTYALVGVAGSFIGYHLGVAFGVPLTSAALYLLAIVGALAVVWLWRGS